MDRLEYAKRASKYSVLLVDDDEVLLSILPRAYKRYFKEVFIANDGLVGIEQYKLHKPDIVISDVTMPNCDGITMAKELKKIDENLKIIFATGHNEAEYLEEFRSFGGYTLTKPITVELLLDMSLRLTGEI